MSQRDSFPQSLGAQPYRDAEFMLRHAERADLSRRSAQSKETLTLVLAGGRGERLYPLTRERSESAVPFGGIYRLIDFTLSNCLHSGLRRICLLPQYKLASLEQHLHSGWNFFHPEAGESLISISPHQQSDKDWYAGTADAVYQNIATLKQNAPKCALILASDHLYRMDYNGLLDYHVRHSSELTIGCVEVELREARRFGIMYTDPHDRVIGFEEKPDAPRSMPGKPGCALASMGIYVFDTEALIEVLLADARHGDSSHDFGRDIIPRMVAEQRAVQAYNVRAEEGENKFYWKDIGAIDAYWEASMDLLSIHPPFDLYDSDWPIYTHYPILPPARILMQDSASRKITDSLICPGTTVVDARVEKSILAPGVEVDHEAEVVESVLLNGVRVGPGARIHRAIIDENVRVPPGYCIGTDPEADRRRFHVSPGGVAVVAELGSARREERQLDPYAFDMAPMGGN